MDSALLGAWVVGEGIIVYRTVARQHRPPMPGELLASSGAFLLLALLGQWQPRLAVTIAVGLDVAAWLNLAGSGVIGTALSGPSGPTVAAVVSGADAAASGLTPGRTPVRVGGGVAGGRAGSVPGTNSGSAASAAGRGGAAGGGGLFGLGGSGAAAGAGAGADAAGGDLLRRLRDLLGGSATVDPRTL